MTTDVCPDCVFAMNPEIPHERGISLSSDDIFENWKMAWKADPSHGPMVVRDAGALPWISDGMARLSEENDDPSVLAAFVLHRVVNRHPFLECNHTAGAFSAFQVMDEAGYDYNGGIEEAKEFVISIDRDGVSEQEVTAWIRAHFTRR